MRKIMVHVWNSSQQFHNDNHFANTLYGNRAIGHLFVISLLHMLVLQETKMVMAKGNTEKAISSIKEYCSV
jgi:hypothetical protein